MRLVALAGLAGPWACSHEVESPKVSLELVAPQIICNEQFPADGIRVDILGEGFTPMPFDVIEEPAQAELPTVLLERARLVDGGGGDGLEVEFSGRPDGQNASRLGWTSENKMTLTFDESNAPESGFYDVTVTNPDGKQSATETIELAVVPPPRIDEVVPGSLCNGFQDQQLTVVGDGFVQIDESKPTIFLRSGEVEHELAVEELSDCVDFDSPTTIRICKSATATVAAESVEPGQYTVSITNPEDARCTSNEDVTIEARLDGPVLFFADPPTVYNGINTRVTLYLTAVSDPFTVSISPSGDLSATTDLDAALVPGRTNRVQATVPEGQEAGEYDITVTDGTGCATTLKDAIDITGDATIELDRVVPPFGHEPESTPVQIFRSGGDPFEETPRAFLNPSDDPNAVAIQLQSVTFVDEDTLSAVVPAGTPVGSYDLVVVNPGGQVGVLPGAYQSLAVAPPVVTDVVPQSIVDQGGQSITALGSGFSGASVSLRCVDPAGAMTPAPQVSSQTETCDAGSCTISATVDGAGLVPGTVCVVRVTNGDESWGEFSAIGITNSSFNLSDPVAGTSLNEGRRALGSVAVKATSAQRFVYAIGGDSGQVSGAMSSVEFAPVDLFGKMSAFVMSPDSMATARSFVATTRIGRYVYAMGGNDGSGALATAERALVLSPEEIPKIEDLDLCLSGGSTACFDDESLGAGLGPGRYSYRVSAMIDATDPVNLGGETLASDPIILRLPDLMNRNILVKILWTPPVDSEGNELSGITGYRVYRTPVDGQPGADEVLLAQIDDPAARELIDDGTAPLGGDVPRPLGATSAWQALPALGVAREGAAAAAAADPTDPSRWYVYALLGRDGAAGHATYEYLAVDLAPNGRQTVSGSWTTGAEQSAVGRWQAGAWTVDSIVSSFVAPGDTWIYLGAGLEADGTTRDGRVEAGMVNAGGELGAFADDPLAGDVVGDFSSVRVGYGTAAAASRLFVFGGRAAQIQQNAIAAEIVGEPDLASNAWNNEGLSMTIPRYLMGSSIQSAFIFLIGGETDTGVTTSTETVVW